MTSSTERLVLAMEVTPTPDDAADALAIAIWAVHRERSGDQPTAAVLDRAAVAPLAEGGSAYDRAVREALAREGARSRSTGRR